MKGLKLLIDSIRSLIDNIGRIFKPSDDHYPATGVVPYTGEDSD